MVPLLKKQCSKDCLKNRIGRSFLFLKKNPQLWGLLLLLAPLLLWGQNSSDNEHFQKAKSFLFTPENDSAVFYFKKAAADFAQQGDWVAYTECYRGMSFFYFQTKSEYEKALACLDSIMPIAKNIQNEADKVDVISSAINFKGNIYQAKGDYTKALAQVQKAIELKKQTTQADSSFLALTYNNLGEIYRTIGDYVLAEEYFQYALQFYDPSKEAWAIANVYNNLALTYQNKEAYEGANAFYLQAISILKNKPEQAETSDFIDYYNNLGMNYLDAAKYDSALLYLHKVMDLHTLSDYDKDVTLHNIGTVYMQQGNLKKAERFMKQALAITLQQKDNTRSGTAIAYLDLGKVAIKQAQTETALQYYQLALQSLQTSFKNENVYQQPSIEDVDNKILMVHILTAKADALFEWKTPVAETTKNLQTALESYQLAAQLIDQIRQTQKAEGSKLALGKKAAYVYEQGMKSALTLYNISEEATFLETAFHFSEKSKAALLFSSIKANEAQLFAHIPDSLKQLEQDLKIDLTFYNKAIFLEKQYGADANTAKIQQWRNRLFDTKRAYEQLKEQLAEAYPQYFALQYDYATATIEDLQTHLADSSLFVEYFTAQDSIYLFAIAPDAVQYHAVCLTPDLQNQIDSLPKMLQQPPVNGQHEAALKNYTFIAHALFKKLLAPVLHASVQHLLLVPDGKLAYLPFETLLTQNADKEANSFRINKMPYLLQSVAIGYAYSATLWVENHTSPPNKPSSSGGLLAFAPVFDTDENSNATARWCNNGSLSPLQFSITEVKGIQKIVGGKAYFQEAATKAIFLKKGPQSSMLHLATHACLEDSDPMHSRIFFAKGDFLSTYDLYNLRLTADLTVLSACNTGSGKWVKGEGMMSLSRGFFYAGCPSVVMSLWSVDDFATSQIMQFFYQHLAQGQNKAVALQQAKLDYLKTADKKASHPFYWAAFVPIGSMKAVDVGGSSFFMWWVWGLGVVLVLGWFFLEIIRQQL